MATNNSVPTLDLNQISGFHSRTISWLPTITNTKHQDYHINILGDIKNKSDFQVLPHRKTVHDFLFLTKGSTKRSKGLDTYEFKGPSIFFLPAYQITQHEMMSEDAEGFYCHFDERIFEFLPKNYLSEQFSFFRFQPSPIINISPDTQEVITTILKRILTLYKTPNEKTNKNLIAFNLLVIFEEIKKEIPIEVKKNKNSFFEITEQYKHALTEHIYVYQQISDYAKLLNITPNYLNKCVKTSVNKTAQDLLKEMLILEAKTLIKYSDLHVSEIAVKLCDQTPSNFARFFKKQTGLTPKEYSKIS